MEITAFTEAFLFSIALGDKLRTLNISLARYINHVEKIVAEKTRDIASIMTHINQGIFAILPGIKIDDVYSKHLETIFDKEELAGKDPIQELLAESDLNEDELSRVRQCLFNSLDEDLINFEVNANHLPREINIRDKVLETDWQSITDDEDRTAKILVSVKDVTSLRMLQNQNKSKEREIEILMEILAVDKEQFKSFISQGFQFLDENEELIQTGVNSEGDTLKTIFINYHTLKGNARGFRFKELSDQFHQAEQYCSEILNQNSPWNESRLMADLTKLKQVLDYYRYVGEEKLNLHDKEEICLSPEVIEQGLCALRNLDAFEKKQCFAFYKALECSFYLPGSEVFKPIEDQAALLAKDLGKRIPDFKINMNDIGFTRKAANLVRNVFTHLVRNSLDHGIESNQERTSSGKSEQGLLCIEMSRTRTYWQLNFNDDGRGLNLQKINQRAIDRNLIETPTSDANEIFSLLTHPGFSTAEAVTEISGRGVGLGAIREYIANAGGRFFISMSSDARADAQSVPVVFSILLPLTFCTFLLETPPRDIKAS